MVLKLAHSTLVTSNVNVRDVVCKTKFKKTLIEPINKEMFTKRKPFTRYETQVCFNYNRTGYNIMSLPAMHISKIDTMRELNYGR